MFPGSEFSAGNSYALRALSCGFYLQENQRVSHRLARPGHIRSAWLEREGDHLGSFHTVSDRIPH